MLGGHLFLYAPSLLCAAKYCDIEQQLCRAREDLQTERVKHSTLQTEVALERGQAASDKVGLVQGMVGWLAGGLVGWWLVWSTVAETCHSLC